MHLFRWSKYKFPRYTYADDIINTMNRKKKNNCWIGVLISLIRNTNLIHTYRLSVSWPLFAFARWTMLSWERMLCAGDLILIRAGDLILISAGDLILIGADSLFVHVFTLYQNGNKTTINLLYFSLIRYTYLARYITTII